MNTILLACDGSEPSARALELAAELAKALTASVHVTSVVPVPPAARRGSGPLRPRRPTGGARRAARARTSPARGAGSRAVLAPPTEIRGALLRLAEEIAADLGSHERSLVERALGTSVSGAVTRRAHRDVLVAH